MDENPADRSPIRSSTELTAGNPQSANRNLLGGHPWLTFLLPFIVFIGLSSFEPGPPEEPMLMPDGKPRPVVNDNWFGMEYAHYPLVYTAKLALTIAAMLFVLSGYRQFPFRISPLAVAVGLVGGVLWIAICNLRLEDYVVDWLGPKSKLVGLLGLAERSSYNPLEQLAATPAWAYTFLAIRFVGLVLIVPVIEEFFLRGFLMRYVVSQNWWQVPFGEANRAAILVGTLFPVLYHPEKLAALAWFSLVTWLMLRTKNIWDCVAAHAITNLMLGIYVVTFGDWRLW